MAEKLAVDGAVALLASTLATVAALAVIIAMLAPVSGRVPLLAVLGGTMFGATLASVLHMRLPPWLIAGALGVHAALFVVVVRRRKAHAAACDEEPRMGQVA